MQVKTPVNLARGQAYGPCGARIISGLAGLLASASLAAAATAYHEDGRAGIRFPIPFVQFEEKTGQQVTALVLADPRVKIPSGIELTSGVYAAAGLPFIVVWKKAERAPPTQKQLLDLAGATPLLRRFLPWARGLPDDLRFDTASLRGIGTLRATGGLSGRALLQVTRDGSVFVGLFFKDPADAVLLDSAGAGLAVLPGRSLSFAELTPGGMPVRTFLLLTLATLGLSGAGMGLTWLRKRRAKAST